MANVAMILKEVEKLSPAEQRRLATKLAELGLVQNGAASSGTEQRSYSKLRALAGSGVSSVRDVSSHTDEHLADIYLGTRRDR